MQIPYLENWLGTWAMEPGRMHALQAAVMGVDLHVHLPAAQAAAAQAAGAGLLTQVQAGVAIITLRGVMMKTQASIGPSTSTVLVRRQVRAAAERPDVQAILLVVESGGGTVAGTGELGADVAAAARQKPTLAYIEDVGASAAYWVASQATKVYANAAAIVGSIGTYGVVHDTSGRAEREGIKVHVVRAGAFKGVGTPGTKIDAAHLGEWQRLVDGQNAMFLAAVAAGRRMPTKRVAELADGRAHLAADAVKLGLIDGVATLDSTFQAIQQLGAAGTLPPAAGKPKGTRNMYADAIQTWDDALQSKLDRNPKLTRSEAVRQVVREQPELHAEYLRQYNARIEEQRALARRR
jgi:signal peptide peptidase SppA